MARLICNDCFNVVMFGGNVKSGNACPKCGSDNTSKGKSIPFSGISLKGCKCRPDFICTTCCALSPYKGEGQARTSTWIDSVRIHNAQVCA
jgi:hypothetical protein